MKELSDKEASELLNWGARFYKMGWEAAFQAISHIGRFSGKPESMKEYLEKEYFKKTKTDSGGCE